MNERKKEREGREREIDHQWCYCRSNGGINQQTYKAYRVERVTKSSPHHRSQLTTRDTKIVVVEQILCSTTQLSSTAIDTNTQCKTTMSLDASNVRLDALFQLSQLNKSKENRNFKI